MNATAEKSVLPERRSALVLTEILVDPEDNTKCFVVGWQGSPGLVRCAGMNRGVFTIDHTVHCTFFNENLTETEEHDALWGLEGQSIQRCKSCIEAEQIAEIGTK